MAKNFIKVLTSTLFYLLTVGAAVDAQATPQPLKASSKYGFAFKPEKSDKIYKSYLKSYPFCIKVGAGKYRAATKYAKGVATFPKVNGKVILANSACKSLSQSVVKGGATLKLRSTGRNSRRFQVSATVPSYCSIRVLSSGKRRIICEGLASSTSATFDLPNGATLIETAAIGDPLPAKRAAIATESCRYQFVNPAGVVRCLTGLEVISYTDQSPLSSGGSLPTFQALSSGSIVFIGGTAEERSGTVLFKLTNGGVLSQLATVENAEETITRFLVESDDRIVYAGNRVTIGSGDVAPFIRTISPAGAVSTVTNDVRTFGGTLISFALKGFDGRALFGLTNVGQVVGDVSTTRIVRVSADGSSLENIISAASALPSGEAIDTFCTGVTGALSAFCEYGGTQITSSHTTSSALYAVARSQAASPPQFLPDNRALVRYTPTLEQVNLSNVTNPLFVSGVGKYLFVSGFNDSAESVLVRYDTETTEELVIATGVLLPAPLRYSGRVGALLGYGNRSSDMARVIFQVPVIGGTPGAPVTTVIPISEGMITSLRFAY